MFDKFKKALADFVAEKIEELDASTTPDAASSASASPTPSADAAAVVKPRHDLPRVEKLPLNIEEVAFSLEQEWTVEAFLDDPDPAKE